MITYSEAVAIQKQFASQVQLIPFNKQPTLVAGVDTSFYKGSDNIFGGIIVIRLPELETVEVVSIAEKECFPYIPGLLSFKELPTLHKAFRKLQSRPEVILVDGQGIAHPRRMGIASHLGVELGIPTIGCAKSILVGTYAALGERKGDRALLNHRGEQVGYALRTKIRCNPLFISPGHLINFQDSVTIVMQCMGKYRLPEPTRRAHNEVNRIRRL